MKHKNARRQYEKPQQQQAYTYILSRAMGSEKFCYSCGADTTPITCWFQQPVGFSMPTQTVYLPEQLYQYVITTTDEEQSTSARVSELVEKGKEVEAGS